MGKKRLDLSFLWRKKTYDQLTVQETNLARVLGIFDVTCIGTSFTVAGVYILLGDVVANNAGPGVVLSFMIAGFATLLAGLCYAELGSRVPRAGSAYTYIYVTIGEFVAFVMGWDLILEYIIGSASIASSLSQNIDFFFDMRIHKAFSDFTTLNVRGLASTPDYLAFALCMVATCLMLLGVKESSHLTKVLTVLNLGFLVFAIILGATKADISNWNISPIVNGTNGTCTDQARAGTGGFLPFGFSGVWSAGAKCFYAYIGFDAICASGEEVKNPQKTIPLGIILTLIIVSVVYFAMSAVLTLMMPYCLINAGTPLPYAFVYVGFGWAKYIVAVGGLISIVACLYSSMYPMPRVVYTMAVDGLIFKPFYYLIPKLKSPYLATLVTGIMASILALIVDLNELINMISIGTLLAYSIVCICVLILRYRPSERVKGEPSYLEYFTQNKEVGIFKKIFWPVSAECDRKSSNLVNLAVSLAVALIIGLSFLLNLSKNMLSAACLVPSIMIVAIILAICVIIRCQPQNQHITTFKAPLMPILPLLAVFINAYLMVNLPIDTAYRFAVWFSLGLVVYFAYGMRNSKENDKKPDAIYPTVDAHFSKKKEEMSPVLERF